MRPGEGTSPLHVLAEGHKERLAVFEERNHLFTKAFHLFQHGMELERKGGDTDVLKCVELIGDLLGGADRTCPSSTVCSNMADCISVCPNYNNFPVDASNRLFKAQTMQPGMFFLSGGLILRSMVSIWRLHQAFSPV